MPSELSFSQTSPTPGRINTSASSLEDELDAVRLKFGGVYSVTGRSPLLLRLLCPRLRVGKIRRNPIVPASSLMRGSEWATKEEDQMDADENGQDSRNDLKQSGRSVR
jgi:hypothetical protein